MNWSFFSLSHGGVILDDSDVIGEYSVTVLHAHPLLKGGKGGMSEQEAAPVKVGTTFEIDIIQVLGH